jgi:hypothetical protein
MNDTAARRKARVQCLRQRRCLLAEALTVQPPIAVDRRHTMRRALRGLA